jgi:outer membrane protein assembly factor BamB
VSAFDPLTGSKLWETKGSTTECVTSPVTDGKLVFTSGGYPTKHVSAVAADGGAKVVWANKSQVYVPSMLVKDGHLYAVQDDGFAVCWRCDTGAERWREKIGGTFSSSPVLVGDRIYATSEAGKTTVFKADPAGFEHLGEAKLGDEVLTTPAICDGRVYTRVAVKASGKREEFLYCLGE